MHRVSRREQVHGEPVSLAARGSCLENGGDDDDEDGVDRRGANSSLVVLGDPPNLQDRRNSDAHFYTRQHCQFVVHSALNCANDEESSQGVLAVRAVPRAHLGRRRGRVLPLLLHLRRGGRGRGGRTTPHHPRRSPARTARFLDRLSGGGGRVQQLRLAAAHGR